MVIQSSQVAMAGSSESVLVTSQSTTASVVTMSAAQAAMAMAETNANTSGQAQSGGDIMVDISDEGKSASNVYTVSRLSMYNYEQEDYRIVLLKQMLKMLTGRDVMLKSPNDFIKKMSQVNSPQKHEFRDMISPVYYNGVGVQTQKLSQLAAASRPIRLNAMQTTQMTYASERMSFSVAGQVKTADGKTIDVSIDLNMSREFYSKVDTTVLSNLKDPLVINYAASSAQVSSTKFAFDIDCDGTKSQISQLISGSGFLAVDWDNDGVVTDGGELFGAKSGNGFLDLAEHDTDGNSWIDENDDIFDKLRIWMWDESGESKLLSLGEAGIGAIYLGNVATNYSLQDGAQVNGFIRNTGFFLRENGTAGTIQHVDLVV